MTQFLDIANRCRKIMSKRAVSRLVEVEVESPEEEIQSGFEAAISNVASGSNEAEELEEEEPDQVEERADWEEETTIDIYLPNGPIDELQIVEHLFNREQFGRQEDMHNHPIVCAWLNDDKDVEFRVDLLKHLANDERSLLNFINEVLLPWALDDRNLLLAVDVLAQSMTAFPEEALNALFLPIFKKKQSVLNDINCGYYRIISHLKGYQQNSLLCNYLDNVKLKYMEVHATILLSFVDQCLLPYSTIKLLVEYFHENLHLFQSSRPFGRVLLTVAENLNNQTPQTIIKSMKNITHHLRPLLRHQIRAVLNKIK